MKTKIYIAVISVFVVFSILLAILKIAISTAYTTAGVELSLLDTETKNVQKQNTLLREQIYEQSSLFTIASKAAELGFEENQKSRIIIGSPFPVAYSQ